MRSVIAIIVVFLGLSPVSIIAGNPQEAYSIGYIVGGHRMAAALARQGQEASNAIRERLKPRLLFFACVAVAVTLFGPEIAEILRRKARGILKIGVNTELALAWTIYLMASIVTIAYGVAALGVRESVPLAILVAGALWPFMAQVIAGIIRDDKQLRKSGVGKIKALFFLCLVVVLVYRLLSGGVANIKVG